LAVVLSLETLINILHLKTQPCFFSTIKLVQLIIVSVDLAIRCYE